MSNQLNGDRLLCPTQSGKENFYMKKLKDMLTKGFANEPQKPKYSPPTKIPGDVLRRDPPPVAQSREEELEIKCPRCTSTKLQYVERKKASIGRAAVGSVLAGPAGAVIGGLTGKGKGVYKCLNCGEEFKID